MAGQTTALDAIVRTELAIEIMNQARGWSRAGRRH